MQFPGAISSQANLAYRCETEYTSATESLFRKVMSQLSGKFDSGAKFTKTKTLNLLQEAQATIPIIIILFIHSNITY
ncbi:MAG: hypothetical protein H6Q71_1497 [Firmicutes bacterium]|nr:hypothetical protein [Bacillota bacterium]